jgi:hypothetical protein
MIADQSKFREANGVLFLLRMLHSSAHDRQFQVILAEILRTQFAPIEENKKAISKILEDPLVIARLFAAEEVTPAPALIKSGSTHSLEVPENTPPPSPVIKGLDSPPSSPPMNGTLTHHSASSTSLAPAGSSQGNMEGFFTWYYSTDPDAILKRTAVEQRIEKLASPLVNLSMKNREKVMGRRNKRLKSVRDRQLRNSLTLNKSLTETKTKSSTRLMKFSTTYQQLQDALKATRQDRLRTGEESWKKLWTGIQEKFPTLGQ